MNDFRKTVAMDHPPVSGTRPSRPAPADEESDGGWMIEETTTNGATRSASQTLFADTETTIFPSSAGPVSVTAQPLYGAPLPIDAPDWARFGRVMSQTIEAAMARAWAAWQMGGVTQAELGSLARSLTRSHRALRSSEGVDREIVAKDCATIVWSGLPAETRAFVSRERVLEIMRRLADVEDAQAARLEGVCLLLSWTDAARAWATEAIAIAMGEIE
jgi:hypothetical protein